MSEVADVPQIGRDGHWLPTLWAAGLLSSFGFAATAAVTILLPDVVPWGSTVLFANLCAAAAIILLVLSATLHSLPERFQQRVRAAGPWLIAIGVWFLLWEISTAKLGWLP